MTVAIEFPTPATYARAVQVSSRFHPELRTTQTRPGVMAGLPLSFAGSNAIVFPIDDRDGSAWALRFFTNARAADPGRYQALERFQTDADLSWPARCRWLDQAINIGDDWYPGLRMEMIDGVLFDQYVLQLASAGDTDSLRTLAEDWRRMVVGLQAAGFAHGDLQHGNVLVEESTGSLRLVDFDGIWLAELADDPPGERGHGSYQHPGRRSAEHWGPLVDTFAGLLGYLSVLALANDPSLHRHTAVGNHLLIAESELADPTGSGAGVLHELMASSETSVAELAALLIEWLQGPANPTDSLEELLTSRVSATTPTPTPPAHSPAGWWDRVVVGAQISPPVASELMTTERARPSVSRIRTEVRAQENTEIESLARTVSSGDTSPTPISPATIPSTGPSRAESPQSNPAAGPTQTSSLGRRLLAGLVDAVLGLFVILHLVSIADGVVPGKNAFALEVRRSDGSRPSNSRLAVRELALKQLPVDLALVGFLSGLLPLVAVAGGWLTAGAVLALLPGGRTLWDHLSDTRVVASDDCGAPLEPASAPDQKGDVWW